MCACLCKIIESETVKDIVEIFGVLGLSVVTVTLNFELFGRYFIILEDYRYIDGYFNYPYFVI